MIQESGGRVTDTEGKPYHLGVRNVIATNGRIHEELQHELAVAEATGV